MSKPTTLLADVTVDLLKLHRETVHQRNTALDEGDETEAAKQDRIRRIIETKLRDHG